MEYYTAVTNQKPILSEKYQILALNKLINLVIYISEIKICTSWGCGED